MKKLLLFAGIGFVLLVLFVFGWFTSVNNNLVGMDENVKAKWSQVENVYQRRADLIPNLVNTVKGYAKHESDVFEKVTEARSKVGQVQINGAADLQKFDQAQSQLSGALSRLMVVAENYPELKANQNFLELQSQLEGTENRISIERRNFNEAAQQYNSYLRKFPQSIVASSRGFEQKPYFAADAGAKTAPKVEF
jgi:LemA protein